MELFGLLNTFPVAEVLQWAANERATGVLVFQRLSVEKRLHIDDGNIVACFSSEPLEYFGRYLLAHGFLSEKKLMRIISHCRKREVRLGQGLVELEQLSRETVEEALRRQIEDSICELFLWERGLFYFTQEELEREELLPSPIHIVGIVMEGARWTDEYARIRETLPFDNLTLQEGARFPGADLPDFEQRIVKEWNRGMTLDDHYRQVGSSRFRFLEAVWRLVGDDVWEIERPGERVPSQSDEVSLIGLLLEQAESERRTAGQPVTLPIDLFLAHYPRLLGRDGGVLAALRGKRHRLEREIDGATRLRDLLSKDPEDRVDDIGWIARQLRKERLALSPVPWDELG